MSARCQQAADELSCRQARFSKC